MQEDSSSDERPVIRARLHAIEGALLTLSRERERGDIGSLQYTRLVSSYEREHEQLEQQLKELQETPVTAE